MFGAQDQHPLQLEAGARQQVDEDTPSESTGQRLVEGGLKHQGRIAILAEQIEQDQVKHPLLSLQIGQRIGVMKGRLLGTLKEAPIEAQHLPIELDTVVFGPGPARRQVAGHVAPPQPQLQYPLCPLGQARLQRLLVGQAECPGSRPAED